MLKLKIMMLAVAGLMLGVTDVEAKRVGGGKTSGETRPAAAKPTQKTEEPATPSGSVSIRVPRAKPGQAPATAAVPAAAAGAAAGSAAATAEAPETTQAPDPQELRKQNDDKLMRAAEEDEKRRSVEEKRAAAIAAYEQEQAERQKRYDREKEERNARRAKQDHEGQCQFKAVMTDDDMARCRSVYRK